jgi:thiaminase/transcriptional activator TenA
MSVDIVAVTSVSDSTASTPFSEWLREGDPALWHRMIEHRFCRDMAEDQLPDEAFIRYLRYEHAFVRGAIGIFAFGLAKAPTPADQDHLLGVLNALATEQQAYFVRAFADLRLDAAVLPSDALPLSACRLQNRLHGFAAEGSFAEILSTMLAAEWMYLTWCEAAHAREPLRPAPAAWIRLHIEPGFRQQVAWLRQRLDEIGPTLGTAERASCRARFGQVLALEIDFHHAPYETG